MFYFTLGNRFFAFPSLTSLLLSAAIHNRQQVFNDFRRVKGHTQLIAAEDLLLQEMYHFQLEQKRVLLDISCCKMEAQYEMSQQKEDVL